VSREIIAFVPLAEAATGLDTVFTGDPADWLTAAGRDGHSVLLKWDGGAATAALRIGAAREQANHISRDLSLGPARSEGGGTLPALDGTLSIRSSFGSTALVFRGRSASEDPAVYEAVTRLLGDVARGLDEARARKTAAAMRRHPAGRAALL
jgi:hypothetical protein